MRSLTGLPYFLEHTDHLMTGWLLHDMLGSYVYDVLINMCCYVRQFRAAYLWCHWLISVPPPNSPAQPTKAQQEVVLALSSPAL